MIETDSFVGSQFKLSQFKETTKMRRPLGAKNDKRGKKVDVYV